jgi:glutamate-1-semialdehyde 2,1-aminomutase
LGIPTSPGVTKGNAADTLLADYNNIESVKHLVKANKNEIAAVIIEPVAGNMGVVRAENSFLKELRLICNEENIVLIFDEVMTGFRLSRQGAQGIYNIKPDMITFGKIIGGGLPVGAFGGKKEIMEMIAPAGPVYQAGTLSGNPLAMAAGFAALTYIKDHSGIYDELENSSAYLENGFIENMNKLHKNYAINRVGSMMTLFFYEGKINSFQTAVKSDTVLFGKYFHEMLTRGIYLAPAQFEAIFISTAHSTVDLDKTIRAHYESLKKII